jgi:hypothetical protein
LSDEMLGKEGRREIPRHRKAPNPAAFLLEGLCARSPSLKQQLSLPQHQWRALVHRASREC